MKQLEFGKIAVSQVKESEADLPVAMALPQLESMDLERLKPWYWDDALSLDPATAALRLAVRSYVVRVDGLNILIDACNGNHKTRSLPFVDNLELPWLDRLAETGLGPNDIHLVTCTHLHADHVGWNTRLENGRWVPTFPNARYVFSRKDLDFYATQQHEPLHRESYDDSVLPVIEAGLADIVESDHVLHREIDDGIWLEDASGHSPGSVCVHAKRGGSHLVFTGDCMHHPVQLVRPDIPFFADEDAAQACATRLRLLQAHADRESILFPAHFRGDGAGQVRSNGDSFQYSFLAR